MKTYPLGLAQAFRPAGSARASFGLFLIILLLAAVGFGAPATNTIPWDDNFENWTNGAPLINGTNGWYSSPGIYDADFPAQSSTVQTVVCHSGTKAVKIAVGDTLSNSFQRQQSVSNIKLTMYAQPQLWTSGVNPLIGSGFSAQFFINSNGYFVVGNGGSWSEASNSPAQSITNIGTNFVQLQIHLQYNTHTWGLKAWTNGVLVASTNNLGFTSNLNYFSGFTIYNGAANSYLDDVTVRRWPSVRVNGVALDAIRLINGALPDGKINDVNAQ